MESDPSDRLPVIAYFHDAEGPRLVKCRVPNCTLTNPVAEIGVGSGGYPSLAFNMTAGASEAGSVVAYYSVGTPGPMDGRLPPGWLAGRRGS